MSMLPQTKENRKFCIFQALDTFILKMMNMPNELIERVLGIVSML